MPQHLLLHITKLWTFMCLIWLNKSVPVPTIPLSNAADPCLRMPVIGLGTGGYVAAQNKSTIPEHWNATQGFINTLKWFSIWDGPSSGPIRFDTADSYPSASGVAAAILNFTNNYKSIARDSIFISSKTGSPFVMGYNDTIIQWKGIINMFQTSYIDLLLIHWPTPTSNDTTYGVSTDPVCNVTNKLYSASKCRQSTWKAFEYIYNNGGAKSIGVANFEQKHLMDIFNMNSLIPSINQFEFHGYWHEFNLVEYCQSYDITVNSYAPLGTPDVMYGTWFPVLTQHQTSVNIGNKYNKSAAQIWLKWAIQQNIVVNPRSWNITHQQQNIDIFDFKLNEEEMLQLSSITPPTHPKVCPNPQNFN